MAILTIIHADFMTQYVYSMAQILMLCSFFASKEIIIYYDSIILNFWDYYVLLLRKIANKSTFPGQIPTLERREESPVSNVHISEEKYEENIRTKSLPLLLDEPQHRKVETRWERTKATAEAKNRPPSLQQQTDLGYQDQRLMQFANIATGPQSPLLQPKPIDWDQQR